MRETPPDGRRQFFIRGIEGFQVLQVITSAIHGCVEFEMNLIESVSDADGKVGMKLELFASTMKTIGQAHAKEIDRPLIDPVGFKPEIIGGDFDGFGERRGQNFRRDDVDILRHALHVPEEVEGRSSAD